jgi:hypothetical protein
MYNLLYRHLCSRVGHGKWQRRLAWPAGWLAQVGASDDFARRRTESNVVTVMDSSFISHDLYAEGNDRCTISPWQPLEANRSAKTHVSTRNSQLLSLVRDRDASCRSAGVSS